MAQEKHFFPQSSPIYIRPLPHYYIYIYIYFFFFNRVGVDPDEDMKAEAANQVRCDFRCMCCINLNHSRRRTFDKKVV